MKMREKSDRAIGAGHEGKKTYVSMREWEG